MKPRTRARAIALQVLYETDIANNHLPGDVLKTRLEEIPLADDLAEFARQIIFGVLPLTQDLDQLIAKKAAGGRPPPVIESARERAEGILLGLL